MDVPQSRWWLVGRGCAVAGGLAVLPALSVPIVAPLLWVCIMTGPFAGLWMTSFWGPADALGWAAGCGLAVAAHPLRPGLLPGALSLAGVGLWVLLGMALTFDGV